MERKQWLTVLMFVVTVAQQGPEENSSPSRGLPRLRVKLMGNQLTWRFITNTSSDSSPVEFTVTVYSKPDLSAEIASEKIFGRVFDLSSLSLQDGTYYIQVRVVSSAETSNTTSNIITYNAAEEDRPSQKSTFTVLVATITAVVGIALLSGSVFFALTMWNIRRRRSEGKEQQSVDRAANTNTVFQQRTRSCLCCSRCWIKGGSGSAAGGGPQLRTVNARDKDGQLLPLHHINRGIIASQLKLELDRRESVSTTASCHMEDLPYGYISPADINIPVSRKYSKSDEQQQRSKQQKTPKARKFSTSSTDQQPYSQQEYENVDFTDSPGFVADRRRRNNDPVSLSDSIYTIPCSLSDIVEEVEYDNAQHYLRVI